MNPMIGTTSLVCIGMHDLHNPQSFRAHSEQKVRLRPTKAVAGLWVENMDTALQPLFKPGVTMFFGLGLPSIMIEGLTDKEHEALCDSVMSRDRSRLSTAAQWLIMLVIDHMADPEVNDDGGVADTGMLRFVASGRSRRRSVMSKLEVKTRASMAVDGNRLASAALEAVRKCLVMTHEVIVWYACKGAVFDLREFNASSVRDKYRDYFAGNAEFKRRSTTHFLYVGKEDKFFVMSDREGAASDGLEALTKFLTTMEVYKADRSVPQPLTSKGEIVKLRSMDAAAMEHLSLEGVRLIDASFLDLRGGVKGAVLKLFQRAQRKAVHAIVLNGVSELDEELVECASNALSPPCVAVTVMLAFFRNMPKRVAHVLPSVPPPSLEESPRWIKTESDLRAVHWQFLEADPFLTDRFWI